MDNLSGNVTASDTEQIVLNGTLLAIAIIGLGLAFLRISWSKFKRVEGEEISLLGKWVITSTAVVMLVAFIIALLIGRSPDPTRPLDPSYLSFFIIMMTAWALLLGIWMFGTSLYINWSVFRKIFNKRVKKECTDVELKALLWDKAPTLLGWSSFCGGLIASIGCAILALFVLSGQAVGLRFSQAMVDWGIWLSWSAVLVFSFSVVMSGIGYILDVLDWWPFLKGHKKK